MKTLRLSSALALLLVAVNLPAQQAAPKAAAPAQPAAPAVTPALKPVDWKADPTMTEYAKQAGSIAIGEWMSEFAAKQLPVKRFAVFRLGADLDDGYFTLQARNEFTSRTAGTEYTLYTREKGELAILDSEAVLADNFRGTMDEATVEEFETKGVQGYILGRVSGVFLGQGTGSGGVRMADDAQILQVRILLQAFEVKTGRLLWGAEKIAAVALPDESLVVPGTKRQWILYGGGALLGLILLMMLHRMLLGANRPR